MIRPESLTELAGYVAKGRHVFVFTADWCGDCTVIKPYLPEIEAQFPDYTFVAVDRDRYPVVAQEWGIFGIPSFVVTADGKEIGRLVSKQRKTKTEIMAFLQSL